MFVETFFACFRKFYFLTQSEYFAWAIAHAKLHCGHFWPFSKCSHFSNISCFLEQFFCIEQSNVFVENFSHVVGNFIFYPK